MKLSILILEYKKEFLHFVPIAQIAILSEILGYLVLNTCTVVKDRKKLRKRGLIVPIQQLILENLQDYMIDFGYWLILIYL